ncbi:MAG TPA: ABC transporter permease [Candidatus Ozemobacteraceae bacterium]|nr:ABC transporter permease [Candidatus Ozemobacteraceae bacterium]
MNAILWKEYLEHRLHFVLIVAMGAVSALALAWFRQLDQDTLTTLLFLFEAPLFLLLLSTHVVSNEVETGSFPFLIGLPRSRTAIWAAKLVFLVLFAAAVYGAYLVIALLAGYLPSPFRLFPSEYDMRLISPAFLLAGFPAAIIACGFAASMLPTGFPSLLGMAFLCAVALCIWSGAHLYLNFALVICLLSVSGLGVSWLVFKRCGLMDGWNRLGWAALGWGIALSCSLGIWAGFDALAERFPNQTSDYTWHFQTSADGKYLALVRESPSTAWDPIQNKQASRLILFDTTTGRQTQVGNRQISFSLLSPSGPKLYRETLYRWPGLFTETSRLIELDLETGREAIIDTDATPEHTASDGTLLYSRQIRLPNGKGVTEFCVRTPQGTQKVLHAMLDTRGNGIWFPDAGALMLEPLGSPIGVPLLVSIADGTTSPLRIPALERDARLSFLGLEDFPGFAVAQISVGSPSHQFTWTFDADGNATEAAWLPPDTVIKSRIDAHRALVLIPEADPDSPSDPLLASNRWKPCIADFQAATLSDVPGWSSPLDRTWGASASRDGKLLCGMVFENGQNVLKTVELATGREVSTVPRSSWQDEVHPLGPSAFLLRGGSAFSRFDPAERRITPIN